MLPEKLTMISEAPETVVSSNGESMASLIASTALFSPLAEPIPIWAIPLSLITVWISAKSRLIRPGLLIRSVTPWTPC